MEMESKLGNQKSSIWQLIKYFIKGKAQPKHHGYFLAGLLLFYGVSLGLSQIFFEGGYSPLKYYISEEGNPITNPNGWYYFTIGMCITALLLISHILYMYNHFSSRTIVFNKLFAIFGIIGCTGLFGVGLVNETIKPYHDIFADIAFGGLGIAVFWMFIICLVQIRNKESWPKPVAFTVFYAIQLIIGTIILIAALIPLVPLNQFSLFQWMGMINILIWVYGGYLLTKSK